MMRFEEYIKVRYEIVLTTHTIIGVDFNSEEEAMKAVPTLCEIFGGDFIRINRREIPCNRWVKE